MNVKERVGIESQYLGQSGNWRAKPI